MSRVTIDESKASPSEVARHHTTKIVGLWLVLSVIADALIWFVWGPHMAPGKMTDTAQGQQFDFKVVTALAAPVVLLIWTYGGYAITHFRDKENGVSTGLDGYFVRGNRKVQAAWYVISTVAVLSLAGFGTYELVVPAGAGGAEGPSPIWTPASSTKQLVVQVIAQQWRFTYRWPQFGGMETTSLELPVGTHVQFDVTSLDVIHDFWPYQLGVKADANPDTNNVAYTMTQQLGRFVVRCDELCGIWHGAMFNYGHVVPKDQFYQWATQMQAQNADVTKYLPKFALTYTPSYLGAGGGYYPPGDPNGAGS